MDAVVTTALLIDVADFGAWRAALKSVEAGNCRIDSKLVSDLYKACPARLKPVFASAHAIPYLPPEDFHSLFEDAYARKLSSIERRDLANTLSVFLRHNPGERSRYRALILELLRSRQREPCLIGISLASKLDDMGLEDLEILQRKLSVAHSPQRHNALVAFYRLVQRYRALHPRVLEFCSSGRLIQQIRQMRREDPDPDVRLCARQALAAYDKLPRVLRTQRPRRARRAALRPGLG